MEPFDLVFRNGHVIDPSQDWDGVADVGIRAGRIAAFGRELNADGCPSICDATGTYLCPGLIDLHGHWYEGGLYGVNAEIGLDHGVTTAVDAGTAGFANFPEFRRTTIETSRARILAFVHVSCLGLHVPFAEELLDLRYARPEETAMVIAAHRERAVGVKVRIGAMTGNHGNQALDLALSAAEQAQAPLMVHISAGANERYILDRLRPGDILTHCFHGNSNGMLSDEPDGFIPAVRAARERGVIFDVGHGCGSFSWETARRAFEHHFWPDTLSTDLHRYSIAEPWHVSMPEVLSKFLCLGMSLRDVILKTTLSPARVLGREGELGTMRPGAPADVLQFRLEEGEYTFRDVHMEPRCGRLRVRPVLVLRAGQCHHPGDTSRSLRPLYPCDDAVFGSISGSFLPSTRE
jgi:dihydroorotase